MPQRYNGPPGWLKYGCLILITALIWDCVLWSSVGGTIAAVSLYSMGKNYVRHRFPVRYTTPLNPHVAEHLCGVLSLDAMDERCQGGDVYAVEFFQDIQRHYGFGTPREEVDRELGVYLIGCEEWENSSDAGWLRRCHYDMRGDGEYELTILYCGGRSDPEDFEEWVWSFPRR
jgi:hypothetical protein